MPRRDVKLKLQKRFGEKKDESQRYRAVLCASNGSRVTGSVWANQDWKLVYFQFFGSGGVGVARCQKIEPQLGLGVYVGRTDDGLEWQVLEDDPFLRRTATDARGYQSISARDFEPGGRLQLWLYTKLIVPLATYDTPGTLKINVVAGDYPYQGTRKTFGGATNKDLSASVPGAGLWRYVGIYLDASNTLQTVNGTASTTASDPAEPSWPAGAFRLSVVRLTNGQTSISFADDIFDRRMGWSDELAGGAGWPFAGVITVSTTDPDADYPNLPDAITNAASGDTIELDSETYTLAAVISTNKSLKIRGQGADKTTVVCSEAGYALTMSASAIAFEALTVRHTGATTGGAVEIGAGSETLEILNAYLLSDAAGAIDNTGLKLSSDSSLVAKIKGSRIEAFNGSGSRIALKITTASFVDIDSASLLLAATKVIECTANNNATILLNSCRIDTTSPTFDIAAADILVGRYVSKENNVIILDGTGYSEYVWLYDTSVGLRIKYPTFAAANAAAASGDTIAVAQPGSYTCAGETLASGRNLYIAPGVVLTGTAQYTLSLAGSNRVWGGGKVEKTGSTAIQAAAVRFTGNTVIIEDIDAICSNSHANGFGFGFYQTDQTGVELRHCRADATGTTGDNYGYRKDTTNGGTCTIIGGKYLGDTNSLYNGATGDVTIIGPELGTVDTGGLGGDVIEGWYNNSNGEIVKIDGTTATVLAIPVDTDSTNDIIRIDNMSDTDFVATINGAPSGSTLVYNAPSSGAEDSIKPAAATQLGKIVLHNTTRGTNLLIDSVDTGTNTITFTSAVPGAWVNGDTITTRSQTNTFSTPYFFDIDMSSSDNTVVPAEATSIEGSMIILDTGGSGEFALHPYAAYSASKSRQLFVNVASKLIVRQARIPLTSQRFTMFVDASGSGTAIVLFRITGYII